MYSCVQCYAILWTSAGHVRLHTRLRCQSIRLGLQDCCMVTVSHTEVELWAVTDEASKVHKNTQVRILINGPRVGLSCTIQWKKCICTLLLPFFKLAKTKKSTWVAVLFYFLTGRSTGTIIQQQPPHLMSIICLFFPLLENIKAAL